MRQVLNIFLIITYEENIVIAILKDKFCEEQAFPYLLPSGKSGYNASRYILKSPSPYFNQRLLNFNQCFTSDADYLCSARSVYEQYHLRPSINVSMHKIRPDTVMAVKNNLKRMIERSVADGNICAYLCVQ